MALRMKNPHNPKAGKLFYFKGQPEGLLKNPREFLGKFSKKPNWFLARRFNASLNQALMSIPTSSARERRAGRVFSLETPTGILWFKVSKSANGTILVKQHPLTHGIRGYNNSFVEFMEVLKNGFKGRAAPNVTVLANRRADHSGWATRQPSTLIKERITLGDAYVLELAAQTSKTGKEGYWGKEFLASASPEQISRVTIYLNPQSNPEELKMKKEFYKKNIPKEFVVRFSKSTISGGI